MKDDYKITQIFLSAPCTRQLHTGNSYGFLLILRGSCTFSWQQQRYTCGTEDIVLMKPGQTLSLEYAGGKYNTQILWLQMLPRLLDQLSDKHNHLERSINVVPFTCATVRAPSSIAMLAKNIVLRLQGSINEQNEFANAIFQHGLLSVFVVLVLRAFIATEFSRKESHRSHFMVDDVFVYIQAHLREEITLETLEQVFFVSKEHIAREFKRQTGQTVHAFIVKAKLDLCAKALLDGKSVADACHIGGFCSYNHFFKVFKSHYGLTPKQFVRSIGDASKNFTNHT